MKISHVSLLIGLILLSVLGLSAAWEFALEELIFPLVAADSEKAAQTGRWQIVGMATIVAALALLVPGLLLRHSIAARRRAEQIADRSASQLRLIIDAVPALIAHVDKDRRYRFGNKQYQDWFGLSSEQIVGRHIREISGEPAYRLIEKNIDMVLSGKANTCVDEVPYKHGDSRVVQRSYVPHLSQDGTVEGYFSVVIDISERQRVEQALKESEARATYAEQRLVEAIEKASDGIALYDAEDRLVLCNERYRAIHESISDLIVPGVHYEDLVRAGYDRGEWASSNAELSAHIEQRLKGNKARVPFELQFRNGSWTETRDYPTADGGVLQYLIDITDRKRTEEALQHSEASLARAQRIAQLGSWDWDVLSDTITWSDEHYRIFGQEKDFFLVTYEKYLTLVHPEDKESFAEAVQRALDTKTPYDARYRIVRPDGMIRFVHDHGETELDDAGKALRMSGTVRDVTEYQHAEQALRRSEGSLAKAQRIARLGNWDWNIVADEIYWSEEHYRIFGQENGAFAITYDAFLSLIHPEDRDSVKVAVRDALEKRVPYDIEYRIVRPDGAIRLMHGLGKAEFAESGRPIRMNGTDQDITERKHIERALGESEHLYRELVELAPDLIWVHCGGTITYINPAGARLLGAESPYAIIGKSARDFIHPDCWDAVRSRIERVTVDRLP